MSRSRPKVFFDGGCRPNPGPIEAAAVIRGETHLFDDLGHGGNGDAEWLALIRALELATALGLRDIELIGDALPVVRRANAALERGTPRDGHEATFLALAATSPPGRIRWIKREQNLAGIALARRHPR
ncbi:ribonuclease HI [Novosphingobium sp. ZW T3_23]|uniref:ribonuclease HI n=1 Tax=Novosphingobium sp. ZW T3_23 TaxID=3378084 RepID=UPI003852CE4A